jgi:hypothetical protein
MLSELLKELKLEKEVDSLEKFDFSFSSPQSLEIITSRLLSAKLLGKILY